MGGETWAENPKIIVQPAWHDFVRLWSACRGGMGGLSHWPDAGGVNDQAAWVVDAFAALAAIESQIEKSERQLRGG